LLAILRDTPMAHLEIDSTHVPIAEVLCG